MKKDKVLHFIFSFGIVTTLLYTLKNTKRKLEISIGITALIGVLKEVYDKYIKKGIFSIGDLMADAMGIMAGTIVTIILHLLGIRNDKND